MVTIARGGDALGETLAEGSTLPASWYTDPARFELEKDVIFGRAWQYAGLLEDLPKPGSFITMRTGDIPIVIVRDRDGGLRGFVNVCRHRGSELVLEPCGVKQSIQCHYHAWTYNLDGTLRAAPGSKGEPNFDPTRFSLHPVRVDTWGPFIFVNPDMDAEPLSVVLGDLPAMVADTGVRLDRIRRRVRGGLDIASNWKIVVENYLECYHCPVAHPGFADVIDVDTYTVTPHGYFSVQSGGVKESAKRGKAQYRVEGDVDEGLYAYIWPHFAVGIYPGPGNVVLNVFEPIDVDHCVNVFEYCFVDSMTDDQIEEFVGFIDQVKREDVALCESVQRGLRSRRFDQGTLMLSRENGIQHFQRVVYDALS